MHNPNFLYCTAVWCTFPHCSCLFLLPLTTCLSFCEWGFFFFFSSFFFFSIFFFISFYFYCLLFFLSFFQPDVCENSVSVSLQGDSSLLAEATLIPPTPEKRGGQVFLSPSLCIHLFLCPFISSFILLAGLLYPFRYVFPPHHPSMWSPTPVLWWFLCAAAWFAF